MNFIDLFAGGGGLSEGFMRAGFTPVAHIEVDKHACTTLETRLMFHKLKANNKLHIYNNYLRGDISRTKLIAEVNDPLIQKSIINEAIGPEKNQDIFNRVDALLNGQKVDLIVGGPPCQAYSLIGRAKDKNKMKNDPRNLLYLQYLKFLVKYSPKVFVFEKCIGFINSKRRRVF